MLPFPGHCLLERSLLLTCWARLLGVLQRRKPGVLNCWPMDVSRLGDRFSSCWRPVVVCIPRFSKKPFQIAQPTRALFADSDPPGRLILTAISVSGFSTQALICCGDFPALRREPTLQVGAMEEMQHRMTTPAIMVVFAISVMARSPGPACLGIETNPLALIVRPSQTSAAPACSAPWPPNRLSLQAGGPLPAFALLHGSALVALHVPWLLEWAGHRARVADRRKAARAGTFVWLLLVLHGAVNSGSGLPRPGLSLTWPSKCGSAPPSC